MSSSNEHLVRDTLRIWDVDAASGAWVQRARLLAANVGSLANCLVHVWIGGVVSRTLRLVLDALGQAAGDIIHTSGRKVIRGKARVPMCLLDAGFLANPSEHRKTSQVL